MVCEFAAASVCVDNAALDAGEELHRLLYLSYFISCRLIMGFFVDLLILISNRMTQIVRCSKVLS